ncbi:tetratricopeptide repeat protein [Streptomyces sp. NPDC091204]|uniref:tetratricopeptide repeat protein n=1 Tax=Streptomyces sp. NPDC091204 TaxID=3155299 RepID=UPI00344576E0
MTDDKNKGTSEQRILRARASGHAQIIQVAGDYRGPAMPEPVSPALTTLPPAPAHLVGRGIESERLLGLLDPTERGQSAVVVSAVAGLAGIGKTALALHAAHEAVARGWFPGGALFVTLHGYDRVQRIDAGQALGTLLRDLGVRDKDLPPTLDEQQGRYQAELAARARQGEPVLVVADDVGSTSQVLPLLPGHRAHRLLITSRHTLDPVALEARHLRLDELDPGPAAALITDALTRVDPADPRLRQEAVALDEIVAYCGQLPLALVIAAALLVADPGLSLTALAGQLKAEHTRLAALHFDDQEGHSLAVRTAFDLSYQRLPPAQARLLRLLSCNPGPDVSTEAATVLNDAPARPVLAALSRAGLLSEQPVGGDRWRMHDLIRLYAHHLHQKADDDGLRQECLDRLLEHYRATAHAADDHLSALPGDRVPERFANQADALAWMDAERLNLLSAVTAAATAERLTHTVSLATSLAVFLGRRRYFDDAVTVAKQALSAARKLGDRRGEGRALNHLGAALREVRRFEEAIKAHTQAVDIFRELEDRHREGAALNNLGLTLRHVRRFEEAIDAHTQAVDIFRELGDRHREGGMLNNLGLALRKARRFEDAINAHTQDLAICRELGDRHREGWALNSLGSALRYVRRFEEAIDAHTQAVDVLRELGDRHRESTALNNLGLALQGVRRFEDAIDAHTQAVDIFRELGDRHREGGALDSLGLALQGVRRFEDAIDAHTQDLAICRELGDRHSEGGALDSLGLALQGVRRFEDAIDAHTQAVDIFRELGDRHSEGGALDSLGLALQGVRRFEDAIDAHTQAVDIFRELGDRHRESTALNNLRAAQKQARRFPRIEGIWRVLTRRAQARPP